MLSMWFLATDHFSSVLDKLDYDLDMSEVLSFFITGLLCQIESNVVMAKQRYRWHAQEKEQICSCQVEDIRVHSPTDN